MATTKTRKSGAWDARLPGSTLEKRRRTMAENDAKWTCCEDCRHGTHGDLRGCAHGIVHRRGQEEGGMTMGQSFGYPPQDHHYAVAG